MLTCEHGGNRVPRALRREFKGWAGLLRTHRGWDPGALELARDLSRELGAPLVASETSRLVIDLNRSLDNQEVFSLRTPARARESLVRSHYRPFRDKALSLMLDAKAPVLHISVHSFTPVRRGVRRRVDIGLLFDPKRPAEARFCRQWRAALTRSRPRWTVRMNEPYRGDSDGHTTALRACFTPDRYVGIELEVNQRLVRAGGAAWRRARRAIVESLVAALDSRGADR